MFPGRKSGFRAGCRPDVNRENSKIGPPACLPPAGGPIWGFPDQNPAAIRPGNPMSGPEAPLGNIGKAASETYLFFRWGFSLSQQHMSVCRRPPVDSDANSYSAKCNINGAMNNGMELRNEVKHPQPGPPGVVDVSTTIKMCFCDGVWSP